MKSRTMLGFDSPYVPGWDCHGLPIEHAVDKELGSKKHEMSRRRDPPRLPRSSPRSTSTSSARTSSASASSATGTIPTPRCPSTTRPTSPTPSAASSRPARVYKGLKPVHWCTYDQTALAEAEVEYASTPRRRSTCASGMTDEAVTAARSPDREAALRRHLDDHAVDAARQPGHRREARLRLRGRRARRRELHRRDASSSSR